MTEIETTTREKVVAKFLETRRATLTEPKQQIIADEIGISKAIVSRYLNEAKEEGLLPDFKDDIHVKRGQLQALFKEIGTPVFIKQQKGAYVSITKFEIDKSGKAIIAK